VTPFFRRVAIVIAAIMVLSLLGQAELAGLIGAVGLLIAVMLYAVSAGRPKFGSGSGSQVRRAHGLSFLGRYRPDDEVERLAGVVVAALAAWATLELVGPQPAESLAVAVVVPALAFIVWTRATAVVLGFLGAVATTIAVMAGSSCDSGVSMVGRGVYLALLVVAGGTFLTARRRPRWRNESGPPKLGFGVAALIGFGVLELAAFIVSPIRGDVFAEAPGWVAPVALVLVAVIAVYAAYAPVLVLHLVAVGVGGAQIVFAAAESRAGAADPACGDPGVGVLYAVAFSILAVIGLSLKPGRRNQS